MGLVYADIELTSTDDLALCRKGYIKPDQIKRTQVRALVDSGCYMLAINEEIRLQLDLPKVDEQISELADGTLKKFDVVGPVEIRFQNRRTSADAVVLPGDTEVLLGSIPLEDLDVIIDPKKQELTVNPKSPYLARKKMKKSAVTAGPSHE
ncbi:MAG: hypothetical protein HQK59_04520 [Deltaproteobacteria bacterium]|nr:hypothetical protein [Deltaproteobacteria bacterium]